MQSTLVTVLNAHTIAYRCDYITITSKVQDAFPPMYPTNYSLPGSGVRMYYFPQAEGSPCDGHHHCDAGSEFCGSARMAGGKHARRCVPCNYCRRGSDSIDGKCPLSCVPQIGAHCDGHHHCDKDTEFCSMVKGHEYKCLSCNFCTKDADAVDKKCPLVTSPTLLCICFITRSLSLL